MDNPHGSPASLVPAALLRAALVVGGLLVLAAGAYVGLRLLIQVAPVALAVVAALLLAALLAPLARALGRLGLPRWLTALVNEMGLIAVLAGALFLAGRRAATQLDDLGQQVGLGLDPSWKRSPSAHGSGSFTCIGRPQQRATVGALGPDHACSFQDGARSSDDLVTAPARRTPRPSRSEPPRCRAPATAAT